MNAENWDVFTSLLKAGCKACREVCPSAGIIIHTEKAGVWEMTRNYYDRLKEAGVDYDIIGLSYYPMWHGTIPNLGRTLDQLAERFPRDHIPSEDAFASVKMHVHLFRYFNGRPGAAALRARLNSVRTLAEIYDAIQNF
jgi:arabinogalactan endo-1,4-beta-galactosidase